MIIIKRKKKGFTCFIVHKDVNFSPQKKNRGKLLITDEHLLYYVFGKRNHGFKVVFFTFSFDFSFIFSLQLILFFIFKIIFIKFFFTTFKFHFYLLFYIYRLPF